MAHFTHYWQTSTVSAHLGLSRSGATSALLDPLASNMFRSRDVQPGDTIHVINFADGVLWIIGRMDVGELIDEAEANRRAK